MIARALAAAIAGAMLSACFAHPLRTVVTATEAPASPPCFPGSYQYIEFGSEPDPGEFAVHVDGDFVGEVHTALTDSALRQLSPSPVRALGRTAFPSSLGPTCRGDDGPTFRFALDERRLPPGLYTISIDTSSGLIRPYNVSVYVAPQPRVQATLRVGQRYIVLPVANIVYRDTLGRTVPWSAISLRIARIVSIDDDVTLAVAGTSYRLREARTGDAVSLLGLDPLVEDHAQRATASQFDGKRIVERGELQGLCASLPLSTMSWPVGAVSVQHVYRAEMPFYPLATDRFAGGNGFGSDSAFEASAPLLVTLKVVSGNHVGPVCSDWYGLFADDWAMRRALGVAPGR